MKSFSLFLSALVYASFATSSHAAPPVVISSLPFIITYPGKYVLAGDLTCPSGVNAIEISTATPGAVVLDMAGHTITGPGSNSLAIGIGDVSGPGEPSNAYPIEIRNGTLMNFSGGVLVDIGTGNSNIVAYASNIRLSHLTFFLDSLTGSTGVSFFRVNSSTIKDCTFTDSDTGILDTHSEGGNSYVNDVFTGVAQPLNLIADKLSGIATTIGRYEFSEPLQN
ncbi:MAG: hypothetical protein JO279_16760 [Verrucomicrobia bacterium]|nr:hypothetical protein [Verrucomicrobiota bacterium]